MRPGTVPSRWLDVDAFYRPPAGGANDYDQEDLGPGEYGRGNGGDCFGYKRKV